MGNCSSKSSSTAVVEETGPSSPPPKRAAPEEQNGTAQAQQPDSELLDLSSNSVGRNASLRMSKPKGGISSKDLMALVDDSEQEPTLHSQEPLDASKYSEPYDLGEDTMTEAEKSVETTLKDLAFYKNQPLSKPDKVMVMQGWNKVLAFQTAFAEALFIYWRILITQQELDNTTTTNNGGEQQPASKSIMDIIEKNQDSMCDALGDRVTEAPELLLGLCDAAVRAFCPHTQVVQREAYRPIHDEVTLQRQKNEFTLECHTLQDHLDLFARLGFQPTWWCLFIRAFLWSLKTHTPYAQEDDYDNLELGVYQSAFARAIALNVALPAVESYRTLVTLHKSPLVHRIQKVWGTFSEEGQAQFGENFYRNLLTNYPELLDYFARTDMDALAVHLSMALDLVIKNIHSLGTTGSFRDALNVLGDVHRRMGVPTYSYALVGGTILKTIQTFFDADEKAQREAAIALGEDDSIIITASDMQSGLAKVYGDVMSIVYYPMLRQERMVNKAREFYEQVKPELQWTDAKFDERMLAVEEEIARTGSYVQTSEELEIGARLAWRNSAKCIGRIAWNTLKVRDCRHISKPKDIFDDVKTHLLEATAGTNIQSIMTVYKPQGQTEPFGTRFWSSQIVRYAAYKDPIDDSIMGDPANLELTSYLIENKYWTPPNEPTQFDVLPLVLKVPGIAKPFIHELPKDCVFEVNLEHPSNPEFNKLGLRWTTVPAISNFKMNLGGITYQNMPFNGWFMSTEIVRNLMERYNVGPKVAQILGLDINTDPAWQNSASSELERMTVHSFRKSGFTIVDPATVGKQFCSHVQREREEFGRECPAQWSWIGGLTGPNNPVWHLEMRDFLLFPQYEYAAESLLLHSAATEVTDDETAVTEVSEALSLEPPEVKVPQVLILYGSETGNAESVARRVKRELAVLKPILKSLNDANSKGFAKLCLSKKITHILAICSTFGKGKPPANAKDFFEAEQSTPIVVDRGYDIKYSVLGMGSSIYPDFCQAGIDLDKILSGKGFERAVDITKVDEAAGVEGAIDEWIALVKNIVLPPNLAEYLSQATELIDQTPVVHSIHWLPEHEPAKTEENERRVEGSFCLSNTELLKTPDETKSIRKITFETPAPYESGDHLSVKPHNSASMINRFLHCFKTELEAHITQKSLGVGMEELYDMPFDILATQGSESESADVFFTRPTTLRHVLGHEVDLSLKNKDVPALLNLVDGAIHEKMSHLDTAQQMEMHETSEYIGLAQEITPILRATSHERSEMIDSFIASYPTIVDFLERFEEVLLGNFFDATPTIGLADVLTILNRLQPRYYSISSSNRMDPSKVTISVGVLNVKTSKGVKIAGVCSNYLSSLEGGTGRADIAVHKSTFRLPEKKDSPIIMVGAGTGLAPMIGFLQEKALDAENGLTIGPIHLFFGCRVEDDFIYEDFIRDLEKKGLVKVHLALSRSKNVPKKYVQHKIEDMGEDMADVLLDENMHYYVCGDARMADACYEACLGLLRKHKQMSRVSSVSHLKKMRLKGHWQSDVWGILSHFETAKKDVMKHKRMAAKLWMSHFNTNDN